MLNFNFESKGQVDEDGLIWKPILRTGKWQYRPGPGGKVRQPLSIVSGRAKNIHSEIGMEDIVTNFKNKVIDHVTVPKNHANKVDENTGFIRALRIEDDPSKPGNKVLLAAHEFTDPEIKKKVLEGSIANNSCGIAPGYIDNETGTVYASVLKHSCLTNEPFIHGMAAFSDEDAEEELYFDEVAEEATSSIFEKLESKIDEKLSEFKELITKNKENGYNYSNKSTVKEFSETSTNGGFTNMPKELTDLNLSDEANIAVAAFMAEREASIKADADAAAKTEADTLLSEVSAEKERIATELAELRKNERVGSVDKYVEDLKELGFDNSPGFLKTVRNILLADSGEEVLTFSEDGKDESLNATGIVEQLVSALPTKDGKIDLSEQVEFVPGTEKPKTDTTEENKPVAERSEEASKWLYSGPVATV